MDIFISTFAGSTNGKELENCIHVYPDGYSVVVTSVGNGYGALAAAAKRIASLPVEYRRVSNEEFSALWKEAIAKNERLSIKQSMRG